MSKRRSLGEVFRWPLVIGVISLIGLVSALLADGFWDGVSWTALSVPVAVGLYKWMADGA